MTTYLKTFEPNLLGRDFVIGDLHGSFSALMNLLVNLEFNPAVDRIISVGDLVDRGPDSLKCLELLHEPWFHSVLSNHEQMMLEAFTGGPLGYYWIMNGGGWGIEALNDARALDINAHARIPEDDSVRLFDLLAIVEKLPFLITVNMSSGKKFHVIHAELPPNHMVSDADLADPEIVRQLVTIETNDGSCFLWGRHKFYPFCRTNLENHAKLVRTVKYNKLDEADDLSHIISGHTIVQHPLTILGQTNIDTAAFDSYSSYEKDHRTSANWCALTAVQLDTWKFYQATETEFREVDPVVINRSDVEQLKENT
jgi:serine/threonine protein phosphatase 1